MTSLTTPRPVLADDDGPPPGRRLRLALVVAGVAVLVVLLTWLVAFSSVLGVGAVSVHGTHTLSVSEVRRAADVAPNTPLVRLDTAAITRRVEQLPEVASAQVDTSFPSTVDITVTERQAVAYLKLRGGSDGEDVLLDHTGFRFRTLTRPPANLPVIDFGGGTGTAGTRAGVAEVAAALPSSLRAQVRSIQALDAASITLVLQHDKVVLWGTATRNEDKARVVEFLLGRKGTRIDVTDPERPVTRRG